MPSQFELNCIGLTFQHIKATLFVTFISDKTIQFIIMKKLYLVLTFIVSQYFYLINFKVSTEKVSATFEKNFFKQFLYKNWLADFIDHPKFSKIIILNKTINLL